MSAGAHVPERRQDHVPQPGPSPHRVEMQAESDLHQAISPLASQAFGRRGGAPPGPPGDDPSRVPAAPVLERARDSGNLSAAGVADSPLKSKRTASPVPGHGHGPVPHGPGPAPGGGPAHSHADAGHPHVSAAGVAAGHAASPSAGHVHGHGGGHGTGHGGHGSGHGGGHGHDHHPHLPEESRERKRQPGRQNDRSPVRTPESDGGPRRTAGRVPVRIGDLPPGPASSPSPAAGASA